MAASSASTATYIEDDDRLIPFVNAPPSTSAQIRTFDVVFFDTQTKKFIPYVYKGTKLADVRGTRSAVVTDAAGPIKILDSGIMVPAVEYLDSNYLINVFSGAKLTQADKDTVDNHIRKFQNTSGPVYTDIANALKTIIIGVPKAEIVDIMSKLKAISDKLNTQSTTFTASDKAAFISNSDTVKQKFAAYCTPTYTTTATGAARVYVPGWAFENGIKRLTENIRRLNIGGATATTIAANNRNWIRNETIIVRNMFIKVVAAAGGRRGSRKTRKTRKARSATRRR